MRIKSFLTLVLLMGVFSCTKPDPVKELVTAYLAQIADVDPATVKIVEVSVPAPYLAADSLAFLAPAFEAAKTERLDQLNKALELSQKAIEEANASKKGGNSVIKALADETIAQAEAQIAEAQRLIPLFTGDYAGTVMEDMYKRIQKYESAKDAVLFNRITGKWRSGDSTEDVVFDLMASPDLSAILGKTPQ